MNGYVCSETGVLPDADERESAASDHVPALAGTFLLRRAHYFTETGKLLPDERRQRAPANPTPAANQAQIKT